MTQPLEMTHTPSREGERGSLLPDLDPSALSQECVGYLLEVVRQRPQGRQMQSGIAAAARVLEWARWREERDGAPEAMLIQLMGSPEKALEWMRKMAPKLEAMVAKAPKLEEGSK